jgi:hypothetical protein
VMVVAMIVPSLGAQFRQEASHGDSLRKGRTRLCP